MKKVKPKKKKNINKLFILFIILDLLAIGGFVMMYGPWDYVRNLYVTTAMKTRNHKYTKLRGTISKVHFVYNSEKGKDKRKSLEDFRNSIDTSEKTTYKDEYEKELLTRDPGNDDYKILDVKVGNAKGYLIAIYKPEKVKLLRTKQFNAGTYGERVVDMCQRYGGSVCINGGGFANGLSNGSDIPLGYVIDEGEVAWTPNNNSASTGNIIGITDEGKLKLMNGVTGEQAVEAGIKYGIEFGPFLIVNGKSLEIVGLPYGVANKCAIAQRKDGVFMFLVTEGESYIDGASLKDVLETLEKYGAYNAANLDGGQSTSLVINNKLINSPNYLAKKQGGRYVVTGFGLIN